MAEAEHQARPDGSGSSANPSSSRGTGIGGRLLEKMLMPIVATAASAAATYAARKAPQILDEQVVPRVRDLLTRAGAGAEGLPSKAKAVVGDAGDVAGRLSARARSAATEAGVALGTSGSNGHRWHTVPTNELQRRQQARASARAQRRTSQR
jgi:cell division septum initiation protein DivIVA